MFTKILELITGKDDLEVLLGGKILGSSMPILEPEEYGFPEGRNDSLTLQL